MTFTDTHCHIHEESYVESERALKDAHKEGVKRLICVGTDEKTSAEAVAFASSHDNVWATVGLHPHDAKSGVEAIRELEHLIKTAPKGKVVAIGECGLDYFYDNSPRDKQIEMLHAQLKLAKKYDLPVIFHVREAFDDFWPIFEQYEGLRGVVHSFTDNSSNLKKAIIHRLYVGVNGIATFARDRQEVYASIPLDNLLLETDAPFLTPVPHRGTLNEPAFITHIAQHIANLQSINLEELSRATERNATTLFLNQN
jgi:TatD DNase family protein